MPVRMNHLRDDRKTFQMPVGDETLTITYRPNAITTALEDAIHDLAKDQRGGAGLAKMLSEAVVSWDLLGDDDQPVPLTEAGLRPLPIAFLSQVATAIGMDLRPNAAKDGTSAAS